MPASPAAVSPHVLARLHDAIRQAVASEEFKTFAHNGGYVPAGSTPAEFRRQILSDFKGFQDIAKTVNMEKG